MDFGQLSDTPSLIIYNILRLVYQIHHLEKTILEEKKTWFIVDQENVIALLSFTDIYDNPSPKLVLG